VRDKHLREQVRSNYSQFDCWGGVVLDGGAHRGYATQLFLDRGARYVVAVEPHPDNCEDWRLNVSDLYGRRARLYEGALVATEDDGQEALYLSGGAGGSMMHSTVQTDDRPSILVEQWNLIDLIREHGITHLKLDVEAAEYDLLGWWLPQSVRWLAMEVHIRRPEWRAQAPWLLRHLEQQGFTWLVPPPEEIDLHTRWGFDIVGHR
jgi:FkbM family methyltransferase